MYKTKIFVSAAAILSLAFLTASCGSKQEDTQDAVPVVRLDTAQMCGEGPVQQYPGRVVAAEDAHVSFKVAGILKHVYVKEGQHVSRGQLLAEMDPTDYKVQLKATEAEYASIKAEAERVIALYKEGGTTASNYDKARYGLEQITAKLQNHRNQLSYTKIYAPYDGLVQEKYMSDGETVGAGTPIVGMLSSGAPEVEINLPASAYANRSKFTHYSCSFDVLPGRVISATPSSTLPQANANQLYTMRLRLTEKCPEISPGMSTWVKVTGDAGNSNVVRIPTTSVLENNDKSQVFVYNPKNQTIKLVNVTIELLHTDGTVEVSGPIAPSTLVVSSGVHNIHNGDKVKPMDPISKTNVGGLM